MKTKTFIPVICIILFWGTATGYVFRDRLFPKTPGTIQDLQQLQSAQTLPTQQPTSPPSLQSAGLHYDATLSPGFQNSQDQTTHYLSVELMTSEADTDTLPVNIALVVDTSGSMYGPKWQHVLLAVQDLVTHRLTEHDQVSLVTYSNEAHLIVPSAPNSPEHAQNIIQKLRAIDPYGGTNISAGIELGAQELGVRKSDSNQPAKRIILLSDGRVTSGITGNQELADLAMTYRETHDVSLSSIGVGLDYNELLMQGLARAGTGNYHFVADEHQVNDILSNEVAGMKSTQQRNISVFLAAPAGVWFTRIHGMENMASFRPESIAVNLGNLPPNSRRDFLVEFQGTLKAPILATFSHTEGKLPHQAVLEIDQTRTNSDLFARAQQIQTLETINGAMRLFGAGNRHRAAQILNDQARDLRTFAKENRTNSKRFLEVAKELEETAKKILVTENTSNEGKFLMKEKFNYANEAISNEVIF